MNVTPRYSPEPTSPPPTTLPLSLPQPPKNKLSFQSGQLRWINTHSSTSISISSTTATTTPSIISTPTCAFPCAFPSGETPHQESSLPQQRHHPLSWPSTSPAYHYAKIILALTAHPDISWHDSARNYQTLSLRWTPPGPPRPHQISALNAWKHAQGAGCCILPTGTGKTYLALMALAEVQRSTAIIVPTLELLYQWQETLESHFATTPQLHIGLWGGGHKDIAAITVMTYDSARIIMPQYGSRFGLMIFDEAHHLAAKGNHIIARSAIAPYRLGLTATPHREDGGEKHLWDLIGPSVYEADVIAMTQETILSAYDVITYEVPLDPVEEKKYLAARAIYSGYLRATGWKFESPGDWQNFVFRARTTPHGRKALQAYQVQKNIAVNASGKIEYLWKILAKHRNGSIIVFTHDNAMAYRIGQTYTLPVLTHHTSKKERKEFLQLFREGRLRVLVTSRVLNEGVDVPHASVGVVVSGSGSIREHVQRLGRVLRHRPGKRACLYELISKNTAELGTHRRRRRHDAYQRAAEVPSSGISDPPQLPT